MWVKQCVLCTQTAFDADTPIDKTLKLQTIIGSLCEHLLLQIIAQKYYFEQQLPKISAKDISHLL